MEYYSQAGQDKFFDEFFKQKNNGVFLEIGAHDGVHLSNTLFFEKFRNWTGACIEANPRLFQRLIKNRSCTCIEGAASNETGVKEFLDIEGVEGLGGLIETYDERHVSRIDRDMEKYNSTGKKVIKVQAFNVTEMLISKGIADIDFCSIDTEGGELSILKAIDLDKIKIKAFTIENNYPLKGAKKYYKDLTKQTVEGYLRSKGYKMIKKLSCDEIFVKKEFLK